MGNPGLETWAAGQPLGGLCNSVALASQLIKQNFSKCLKAATLAEALVVAGTSFFMFGEH